MARRSLLVATSISLVALLAMAVAPATATAKDGVEARLEAPMPIDGPPGSTFQMRWLLVAVADDGTTSPVFGSPIYVRLIPADGGPVIELEAREVTEGSGRYVSNVTVPDGGISRMEVAMRGQACDASGCRRSDLTFPFAPGLATVVPPASSVDRSTGTAITTSLAPMVALVTAIAIAAALGAAVVGRRAAAAARPGADPGLIG